MKKLSVAILAVIYLVVSTGFVIDVHYCMGKVSSVGVLQHDKCGKCGMEMSSKGCCKDELKIIKLQDTHKLVSNNIQFLVPFAIIQHFDDQINSKPVIACNNYFKFSNSPPGETGSTLNILHSVFRI